AAAGAGRLFPAGRLLGGQRPRRFRVLPLADHGEGCHRDPAFPVLRGAATRPAAGAAVLRQERGDAGRGDRAATEALNRDAFVKRLRTRAFSGRLRIIGELAAEAAPTELLEHRPCRTCASPSSRVPPCGTTPPATATTTAA